VNGDRGIHPAGARLDAVATGDADREALAHVASCPECAAYVGRLREQIEAFSEMQRKSPDGFVEGVVRRRSARAGKRNAGRWAAVVTGGLALAAGALLFVHRPGGGGGGPLEGPSSVGGEGPIRFKGGAQVTVIVDHHGTQARETGALQIAAGDRIRLEIALDHDSDVTAGVLSAAGEWAELEPPTFLPSGTHFSDRSIAFDADVGEGWVIVGPPRAVEQARRTRDFAAVHALRIHPAPP
jgi:hypothetical protein